MKVTILTPVAKPKVKKRVCAYVRVSTDSKSQGESFENQIRYYENRIKTNEEYEFAGVFADRGYTGTKDNRPEFQKMLALCRVGKIDKILAKSISRFARNTTIVLEYVRELKDLGIEVYFEEENISTMSKDGEFMLTVLSSFAEEESRSVSENIKWRMRKKFERGEMILCTKRFLGYDKDEYGDLVINQKEAEIVRRVFIEYVQGKGTFTIAKEFNEEGIPTVTGAKWHDNTILNMLKNEKYKGDAILQKYYQKDHIKKQKRRNDGDYESFYLKENHSPIISEEMWQQVQELIKKRCRNTKPQNRNNPLAGKLFCSKCGAPLRRRIWNSGKPRAKAVWQCSNYIENGKNACSGTVIAEKELEQLDIKEKMIIKEWIVNGEKHYTYTSKSCE